jgi:hypothetical protein
MGLKSVEECSPWPHRPIFADTRHWILQVVMPSFDLGSEPYVSRQQYALLQALAQEDGLAKGPRKFEELSFAFVVSRANALLLRTTVNGLPLRLAEH